ncbi:unnamed protein product [Brassica rapa]|uniref:Uncharacterized protein n=2 Tax=Brassica TaxID=3705 RepID=A0A8D9HIL3_BRACM|nr:unnamed protein product [Brassica napus]CAG7899930.1 unnamed protein product [Brassica rapa]
METVTYCLFNQQYVILFECSFSYQIWQVMVMAARSGLQARPQWEETVNQLLSLTGNRNRRRLMLLAWQSTIYSIWRERNLRINQHVFRSTDTIITFLDRQIRNQIQSFRESRPRQVSLLMQLWFSTG